jgi:hypothetical protein
MGRAHQSMCYDYYFLIVTVPFNVPDTDTDRILQSIVCEFYHERYGIVNSSDYEVNSNCSNYFNVPIYLPVFRKIHNL